MWKSTQKAFQWLHSEPTLVTNSTNSWVVYYVQLFWKNYSSISVYAQFPTFPLANNTWFILKNQLKAIYISYFWVMLGLYISQCELAQVVAEMISDIGNKRPSCISYNDYHWHTYLGARKYIQYSQCMTNPSYEGMLHSL